MRAVAARSRRRADRRPRRGALGHRRRAAPSEETFWAIRRLLETLARERPLVVCLEDVHWAEPTFLDLLEYVAGWSRDAPILLLCLARPELLDERPRWGGAAAHARAADRARSRRTLLDELGGASGRSRRRARGSPRPPRAIRSSSSRWSRCSRRRRRGAIPPTIQALLAARLDRLEPLERARARARRGRRQGVLARRGAELSPADERADVSARAALARAQGARPPGALALSSATTASASGTLLIRDAAYAGIPKGVARRAARALRALARGRASAARTSSSATTSSRRTGTGPSSGSPTARGSPTRRRPARRRRRRAFARDDTPAAANLLERALELARLPRDQAELLRDLAGARWATGDVAGAAAVLDEAIEIAGHAGDLRQEWYGRLERAARRRTTRAERRRPRRGRNGGGRRLHHARGRPRPRPRLAPARARLLHELPLRGGGCAERARAGARPAHGRRVRGGAQRRHRLLRPPLRPGAGGRRCSALPRPAPPRRGRIRCSRPQHAARSPGWRRCRGRCGRAR